jgi:hypothetical protein
MNTRYTSKYIGVARKEDSFVPRNHSIYLHKEKLRTIIPDRHTNIIHINIFISLVLMLTPPFILLDHCFGS